MLFDDSSQKATHRITLQRQRLLTKATLESQSDFTITSSEHLSLNRVISQRSHEILETYKEMNEKYIILIQLSEYDTCDQW